MRFVSLLAAISLATACGPGRSTYARYPGGAIQFDRTSQDAKALEIADQVITAAGGPTKWTTAKQLRWELSVQSDGKEVIAGEQAWDRWNGRHWGKARREDGNIVVMRSLYEDDAKVFMEKQDKLRKIEGGAEDAVKAATFRWEFDTAVLCMPFLLQEPGTKLEVAGEAKSDDGKEQDVLKVTFDPKDRTRNAIYFVVIDRDTHMISRIEIQKAGKPENEREGWMIAAWSDAGGLKYPASVQNMGNKTEAVTFKNLKVTDPEDDLWTPPPLM